MGKGYADPPLALLEISEQETHPAPAALLHGAVDPGLLAAVDLEQLEGDAGPVHANLFLSAPGAVLHDPQVRLSVQAARHHFALQLLLVDVALKGQRLDAGGVG